MHLMSFDVSHITAIAVNIPLFLFEVFARETIVPSTYNEIIMC